MKEIWSEVYAAGGRERLYLKEEVIDGARFQRRDTQTLEEIVVTFSF